MIREVQNEWDLSSESDDDENQDDETARNKKILKKHIRM